MERHSHRDGRWWLRPYGTGDGKRSGNWCGRKLSRELTLSFSQSFGGAFLSATGHGLSNSPFADQPVAVPHATWLVEVHQASTVIQKRLHQTTIQFFPLPCVLLRCVPGVLPRRKERARADHVPAMYAPVARREARRSTSSDNKNNQARCQSMCFRPDVAARQTNPRAHLRPRTGA